ncbi:MAG: putative toxin-antitoxin system toxin component, PIN family [Cytophagaceae bacterium]|nr:putative toxin-antitoxin system toxin component, PIN family [Cytophagaceae bacterium]
MEKNRVVLDTNVLISSVIGKPESFPYRAVRQCLGVERRGVICLSEEILAVYYRFVGYPNLNRFVIFHDEALALLNDLQPIAEFYQPTQRLSVIRDEPDNRFLELAVAAKAQFLITGNTQDFTFSHFEGVRIVSPKEFVETHCN